MSVRTFRNHNVKRDCNSQVFGVQSHWVHIYLQSTIKTRFVGPFLWSSESCRRALRCRHAFEWAAVCLPCQMEDAAHFTDTCCEDLEIWLHAIASRSLCESMCKECAAVVCTRMKINTTVGYLTVFGSLCHVTDVCVANIILEGTK